MKLDQTYRFHQRVFGREIILHGISITDDGEPVLPCMVGLLDEMGKWLQCREFIYDANDKQWTHVLPNINGN